MFSYLHISSLNSLLNLERVANKHFYVLISYTHRKGKIFPPATNFTLEWAWKSIKIFLHASMFPTTHSSLPWPPLPPLFSCTPKTTFHYSYIHIYTVYKLIMFSLLGVSHCPVDIEMKNRLSWISHINQQTALIYLTWST